MSMKRPYAAMGSPPQLWGSLFAIVALMSMLAALALAQSPSPESSDGFTIQGTVHDAAGKPVGDAAVRLERSGAPGVVETKTNAAGVFGFSALGAGTYLISAEKSDLYNCATAVVISSQETRRQVDLVLTAWGGIPTD